MNKLQRYKILATLGIIVFFLAIVFNDNKSLSDMLSLLLTGITIMTLLNNKTV